MATKIGNISNKTINGTSAADTLWGRGGDDTLYGLAGNDKLYGEAEQILFGENGDVPVLPIYFYTYVALERENVTARPAVIRATAAARAISSSRDRRTHASARHTMIDTAR